MLSKKVTLRPVHDPGESHATTFSKRYFREPIPKNLLPERSMPAEAAYQLIHDETES